MIITKLALPRRTFLRGVGVTLALPLLDAMVPALSAMTKTAAKPVPRLGFVYVPNGVILDKFTPASEGAGFEFTPILKPLEHLRDRVTVLSGLALKPAEAAGDGSGDHARGSAGWLSAVHAKRTEGADLEGGKTIDQMAADKLGTDTPLRSLELAVDDVSQLIGSCDSGYACSYTNTLSWRTPTTPLPMQTNPRVVFERLFGDGGGVEQRIAQSREDRSILDSITEAARQLERRLGSRDRIKFDQYLDGIREVERRITRVEEQSNENLALPTPPVGVPDSVEEHLKLMLDMQVLAYQADVTRVCTFMLGRELSQRTYGQIGVPEPHHGLSHHGGDAAQIAKVIKIDTYHVSLLAYYLDKLQSTTDGDGTLLDHSLILYGGSIGNGNAHTHSPLPALLAGGAVGQLKGGRHLQYPAGTPIANLLLSLLDKVGVELDDIGDSTGRLTGV
jgi:hypothetical protein